jgi:hypothetical protein
MKQRMRRTATVWCLGGMFWLPSCRSPQPVAPRPAVALAADETRLALAISRLGPSVDRAESHRLAQVIVRTVEDARMASALDGGALRRNVAVNLGLHDWGLCWHWTEHLGRRLRQERLQSLTFHWACAHSGSTLREHNALVVTARDQTFADGLVIDPWRRGGHLTWVRVAEDRYPWKHEPHSEARW